MDEIYKLLNDRLEGWELAELLELSALDLCQEFEDKIQDKLEQLKELLEIEEDDENEATE